MPLTLVVILKTLLFAVPITVVLTLLFKMLFRWIELDIELPGCLTGIAILLIISSLFVYPRVYKHETKDKTNVHELYSPDNIPTTYYNNADIPDAFESYRGEDHVYVNKTGTTLVIYEVVYTPAGYQEQLRRMPEAKTIEPDEYFKWYDGLDDEKHYKMFVVPPSKQTYTTSRFSNSKNLPSYIKFLDYYNASYVKDEIRGMKISRYNKP